MKLNKHHSANKSHKTYNIIIMYFVFKVSNKKY